MSEGRRPLAPRPYYARLTQALITAMTAPMAEGKLYEVDMRLRPSGNQGPVATSLASFRTYQQTEAWVWEHLALTRARVVAGPEDLAEDVRTVQAEVLAKPRDAADVLKEVATMRARIAAAKGAGDPWDPKLGQGRMQDIELVAQAAALVSGCPLGTVTDALDHGAARGLYGPDAAAHLSETYRLCWALQVGARLISESALAPKSGHSALSDFLCRLTNVTTLDDLRSSLEQSTSRAADLINAALPKAPEEA